MAMHSSQHASHTMIISKLHGKFERYVAVLSAQIFGTKILLFSKERVMTFPPSTRPTCSSCIYCIRELGLRHVSDTAALFPIQLWIFRKESGTYRQGNYYYSSNLRRVGR